MWAVAVTVAVAALAVLLALGPLSPHYSCISVHGHTVCGGVVAP